MFYFYCGKTYNKLHTFSMRCIPCCLFRLLNEVHATLLFCVVEWGGYHAIFKNICHLYWMTGLIRFLKHGIFVFFFLDINVIIWMIKMLSLGRWNLGNVVLDWLLFHIFLWQTLSIPNIFSNWKKFVYCWMRCITYCL